MGIDKGFDLFPPLTESAEDKEKWTAFLNEVKHMYENDDKVEIKKKGIFALEVQQGEGPRLTVEGHRFRRFSSKISGSHARDVERYLDEVEVIAIRHFGRRIHPWNEIDVYQCWENMCYSWREVYDTEAEG